MIDIIFSGPKQGTLFVFAHGAGAPLDSDFMESVTQGLINNGIRVARFNFEYMQQRVETGSRRPPQRAPALVEQFHNVLKQLDQPVVIGGKSMGGRMASLLACETQLAGHHFIKGIACLGYPFHPQGKPEKLRIDHLFDIKQPLAIIQGCRDKLGNQEEIQSYSLPKTINWCWLADGDHDFKPRIKSGYNQQQHITQAVNYLCDFINSCTLK